MSQYPAQYETKITTSGGVTIFVRPIKPEDGPLLVTLFEGLSNRSIYYRFFTPLKQLPPDMLARFTQIDYDSDMALAAFARDHSGSTGKLLGVSRLFREPKGNRAEFSVVVSDPWHGKGIGAALLQKLIAIAGERRIAFLWGLVLAENTQMLALGKKLGFSISRDACSNLYRLEKDVTSLFPLPDRTHP
jgi:acetyltransferase